MIKVIVLIMIVTTSCQQQSLNKHMIADSFEANNPGTVDSINTCIDYSQAYK